MNVFGKKVIGTTLNWTQIAKDPEIFPAGFNHLKTLRIEEDIKASYLATAIILTTLFGLLLNISSPRIPQIHIGFCVLLGSLLAVNMGALIYIDVKKRRAKNKIDEDEANPNHPFLLTILNKHLEWCREDIKRMQFYMLTDFLGAGYRRQVIKIHIDSIEKLNPYLIFSEMV